MSGRLLVKASPKNIWINPDYSSLIRVGNRSSSPLNGKLVTAYDAISRLSLTPDQIDERVARHQMRYLGYQQRELQ